MVVSYTFTIESTGGNGIVVPGWGFLLNNELTDFNIDDPDPRERAGGRQAAALLDRADVRRAPRPAVPGRRLAGRRDDHHHGAADPDRADRLRPLAAGRDRRPARQPAQRDDHRGRAGVRSTRTARRSRLAATRSALPAEIGAATGIEFLPGGRFLAAAEPVRRGGGSAQVVRPLAEVGEHRQRGAGVVHDGVRVGELLGGERDRWRPRSRARGRRARRRCRAACRRSRPCARAAIRRRGRARPPAARRAARRPSRSRPARRRSSRRSRRAPACAARPPRGCRSRAPAGTRPGSSASASSASVTPGATCAERSAGHSSS